MNEVDAPDVIGVFGTQPEHPLTYDINAGCGPRIECSLLTSMQPLLNTGTLLEIIEVLLSK